MAAILQLLSAITGDTVIEETDMAVVGSLNFNAQPSNVDHGPFWTVDTLYGDCYWSAWVCPTVPNALGYYISDGSGGAHNVLAGMATNGTTGGATGNIWNGTATCSYSSVDNIPLGEWVHYEFIVVGQVMYLLCNGICSFYGSLTAGGVWTSTFADTRQFGAGGSNGHLYVGGSYHNNFPGRVARIRGVEGGHANITAINAYVPRYYDGYISDGSNLTRCDFVADYSVGGTRLFIDGGAGFESRIHHGAFSRYNESVPDPVWVAGDITPSTSVPTPPSTPANALVFDSFSRKNSLFLFDEQPTLGDTETGSLGVKTWRSPYWANNDSGVGILSGSAILYTGQAEYAWVTTDRTDVDLRVTRPNKPWASTGLLARHIDANNYYMVKGYDDVILFTFNEDGSQSFPTGINVPTGWTELKVTVSGTTLTVFTDGVSRGTKTVLNNGSAVNHGISLGGHCSRYNEFTILPVA